jgi:dipeptidyl aminopeptidase/acylaminoacyl peptidase
LKKFGTIFSISALFLCTTGCEGNKGVPVEEIVRFDSDGVLLEGVLSLPGNSEKKHPLAVFVHGSGRATRNDYEEFLEPLLKEGIALFRYDKRGVGASGGMYINVDTENSERTFSILASDAAAAIRHLKKDNRIDAGKIMLIGGSQAGWIIPEITTIADTWLTVCISGPSVTVGEEIYYSDLAENGTHTQEHADRRLADFNGVRGYDPISRIGKMKKPSLWLFGSNDVSIPVKKCIHLLDSIKSSHVLPLEMNVYPDSDHGLYNAVTRMREDYVNFIIQWIRKHR